MAGERGQATIEYAGLLALVAALLAGALALARAPVADALPRAVVGGIHRGLCLVRAGECDLAEHPCVVGERDVVDRGSVDLAVVHVGSDELVLRQDQSDGTSLVTFARDRRGGLQLGAGTSGHLRIGRLRFQGGAEVSATVLGLISSATTWRLPDRAAAARLVDRIVVDGPRDLARRVRDRGRPAGDDAPAPESTTTGVGAGVELAGGLSRGTSAGTLRLHAEDLAGATREPATGRRTYLVRRRNQLAGTLGTRLRELAHGTAGADELYTVTVERGGRPVDLGILRGGDLAAGLDLPRIVQPVAGFLRVGGAGGRRWETEEHLDLTEATSLAAAKDFLDQVVTPRPHPGRAVDVSRKLRATLDERGVLDARTYAISSSSSGGLGAGARLPVAGKVGADYERGTQRARLLAAVQRTDGLWHKRTDCAA